MTTLSCGCVKDGNFTFPCTTHSGVITVETGRQIPLDVDPRNQIIRELQLQVREQQEKLESFCDLLEESNRLNGEMLELVRKIDAYFENPKIKLFEKAVILDIPYEIAAGVKAVLTTPVKRNDACTCTVSLNGLHVTGCPQRRPGPPQKCEHCGSTRLSDSAWNGHKHCPDCCNNTKVD